MRVIIDRFKTNNPDLKIEDVIYDIKGANKENGIAVLNFKTKDKYHYVLDNMTCHGPNYSGQGIIIEPIIYDKDNDGNICELAEDDMIAYTNHPDYYHLFLCIETDIDGCISVVTPLKHEYSITWIEYKQAFGYDRLNELSVVYETECE